MDAIPSTIHEGMKVVDASMHPIGTVEAFRATEGAPDNPDIDAAGVSPALAERQDSLVDVLADVFKPDDALPRELQEKALAQGFVRLDADGFFAADRYIFPEHIDRVAGDTLVLNVRKDDLLKV